MKRGQIYQAQAPEGDTKRQRCFVIVSRQVLIDSSYATIVCAPIFTNGTGLSTQVPVGPEEGLKHHSWIACDNLRSMPKRDLTHFVGSLSELKLDRLNQALQIALALD